MLDLMHVCLCCQREQKSSETEPLLQNSSHIDRTANGAINVEPSEVTVEPSEVTVAPTEAISFCEALSIPVSEGGCYH